MSAIVPELIVVVLVAATHALRARTSGVQGPGPWKHVPVVAGGLALGLLRLFHVIPRWPDVSWADLATVMLLISATWCVVLDFRSVAEWLSAWDRRSNRYRVVLLLMTWIAALLVGTWVTYAGGTAVSLYTDLQAGGILEASRATGSWAAR
jgi:hypothetical protein